MIRTHLRIGFCSLGLITLSTPGWSATPPVITPNDGPDLSILDMESTPEEHMVSGGEVPGTPESGNENPEDLLTSSPMTGAIKPKKATSSSDGLPKKLPTTHAPESTASAEELPPLPALEESTEEPVAETSAELEQVDVPAEPEVVTLTPTEEPSEGQSTSRFDRSIPPYDRENPTVGIDIHASLQSLGSTIKSESSLAPGVLNESNVRNFGVGFEYEPKFMQSIGVFSLGPSVNMYVLDPAGDLTESAFSIFSLGFSGKYQLKFMRSQILVPFVGFEAQMIRYSFHEETGLGTGWTTTTGPTFGGMLLLNWMEPSSAHNLFAEYGIKRTYLVGEAKLLKADNALFSVDGTAVYFGMRMEY